MSKKKKKSDNETLDTFLAKITEIIDRPEQSDAIILAAIDKATKIVALKNKVEEEYGTGFQEEEK